MQQSLPVVTSLLKKTHVCQSSVCTGGETLCCDVTDAVISRLLIAHAVCVGKRSRHSSHVEEILLMG